MSREEKELILEVLKPYVICGKVGINQVEKVMEELVDFLHCKNGDPTEKSMREERCVCCGAIIPEGRQVCINCETRGTQQERDEKNERRNTSIFQKQAAEAAGRSKKE